MSKTSKYVGTVRSSTGMRGHPGITPSQGGASRARDYGSATARGTTTPTSLPKTNPSGFQPAKK